MTESSHRTPAAERTPLVAPRTASVVVERDRAAESGPATTVDRIASVDDILATAPSAPAVGSQAAIPIASAPPAATSSVGPLSVALPSVGTASVGTASVGIASARGPFSGAYPDRPTVELSESLAPGWFLFLFASSFLALAYLFSAFFADLVLAFMLVGVFRSTYERIRKGVGNRPWLASALTTSLIGIVVVGPASLLALTIAKEARTVYTASQNAFSDEWVAHHAQGRAAVRSVRALVEGLGLEVSVADVQGAITHGANSLKDMVSERASEALSNVFASLLHFLLIALILFYMFVDGERLKRFAFRLSPLPDDEDALLALKFTAVARAILLGSGISAMVQGSLGAASMMLVGLPSAVLWGSIMAVLAFLPVFGPLLVVVPASAYLWLDGRRDAALLFFVFNALQHLVVENVVKTRLIGAQMRLHDLLVFLSILGGIAAFGVMGLVYGPLIVTIFTTLSEFYERHYRRVMARAFALRD